MSHKDLFYSYRDMSWAYGWATDYYGATYGVMRTDADHCGHVADYYFRLYQQGLGNYYEA